ncbi:hypothetical protein BV96_01772 [Sphingomonas paucimobilis]|nr:hypothetical protein BV96_01772 [Sphingomonas paucimobilis]
MSERTMEIHECPFGSRFILVFMPRSVSLPSMEFRTHADALACAHARSKAHGWPVIDKTGGSHG